MKRYIPPVLLCCIATALSAVSVRDFGAVGDGRTDDTAAIQKAVSTLSGRIKLDRFRTEDDWYGGTSETHVEELFFPAGTYKISRTIYAAGSVAWHGEKGTKIILDNPKQDLLYVDHYRRAIFDHLEFSGGQTHIQLWSQNWNASSVHIVHCTFRNSAAPAIRSVSRRLDNNIDWNKTPFHKAKIELAPPYDVKITDGVPILTPRGGEKTVPWYSSNIISVRNCDFLNCLQSFEFNNDGTLVDNCRIVVNPETEGPVMLAGIGPAPNMLTIRNLRAEAPATGKTQYWIKNEGFYLSCRDSEFKSVRPMLFLDQKTLKIPHYSTAGNISIVRCAFHAAGNPENAIVALHRVPSIFTFLDNRESGSQSVPLFKWDVTPDRNYLETDSFRGKHQNIPWDINCKYGLLIGGNQSIDVNLPEALVPFRRAVPSGLAEKPQAPSPLPHIFNGEIRAVDFGVKGDGKTDDAPAFARALAEAAKSRRTLVVPSGRIRFASTVTLPATVSIRGEGLPVISGDKRGTYDLFRIPEIGDIRFRTLLLRNCGRIFNGVITPDSRRFVLDDCLFYDTGPISMEFLNAPGVKQNRCELRFTALLWQGVGGVISEAKRNFVEMSWLSNNYWMDDQAMFTVRNGAVLIMQNGFFVPYISKGIKRTNSVTGEVKVWELGNNLRWVDNFGGDVFLYDCRGGGEGGGYCTLHQKAPGGTVLIEGGLGRFTNRDTQNVLFYAASAPERAILAGIGGYPVSALLGVKQQVWKKAPGVPDFPIEAVAVMTPQPQEEPLKSKEK